MPKASKLDCTLGAWEHMLEKPGFMLAKNPRARTCTEGFLAIGCHKRPREDVGRIRRLWALPLFLYKSA